jgi:predicted metalloprotease with PDZ domain
MLQEKKQQFGFFTRLTEEMKKGTDSLDDVVLRMWEQFGHPPIQTPAMASYRFQSTHNLLPIGR